MHSEVSCTTNTVNTYTDNNDNDEVTWIREDTLTMRLAIPPD